MIEPAASYSFNKSHAACYAHIAYQTAYLKAHYPIEFYASLMRSVQDDTEKLATAIQESREHGIPVAAPAVNTAYTHIAAIDNTIVL
jgi:DNA polymerase-3 subunit alpha